MAKLVYSYHNKKRTVTSFKSLWRHQLSRKYYFLVDSDGNLGVIEYYTRFIKFLDTPRPGEYFEKNNDFSFAKRLLDDHNHHIRQLMHDANQQIKVECDTPDHTGEYVAMADILERAFIIYKGQQFF